MIYIFNISNGSLNHVSFQPSDKAPSNGSWSPYDHWPVLRAPNFRPHVQEFPSHQLHRWTVLPSYTLGTNIWQRSPFCSWNWSNSKVHLKYPTIFLLCFCRLPLQMLQFCTKENLFSFQSIFRYRPWRLQFPSKSQSKSRICQRNVRSTDQRVNNQPLWLLWVTPRRGYFYVFLLYHQ